MRTMRRVGHLDYGTKDQIVIMKNMNGYSRNFISFFLQNHKNEKKLAQERKPFNRKSK